MDSNSVKVNGQTNGSFCLALQSEGHVMTATSAYPNKGHYVDISIFDLSVEEIRTIALKILVEAAKFSSASTLA